MTQVKDLTDAEALSVVRAVSRLLRQTLAAPSVVNVLEARGYPWKVAERKLEQLARRGLVECGVTIHRPWLTPAGEAALDERG